MKFIGENLLDLIDQKRQEITTAKIQKTALALAEEL